MLKAKVLSKSIVLPNATSAALRSIVIDSEPDYKNVRGFYLIRNAGTQYLKISIADQAGNTILAPVNVQHLIVDGSVAIKEKFFTGTPFEGAGKKFTVYYENFAATAAEQNLDFVYLVDNEPINQ